MKNFVKENIALVAGIVLPLVLVVIFLIAGEISKASAPELKHDMLFTTNYYPHNNHHHYRFKVDNGKLVVTYKVPADDDEHRHYHKNPPKLYLYDHKTQYASLLDIDWENEENGIIKDPDINALNQNKLLTNEVSPEGYSLEYHYRGSRGLVGELFSYSGSRSRYALKNENFVIPLKGVDNFYNADFIAWVEKK